MTQMPITMLGIQKKYCCYLTEEETFAFADIKFCRLIGFEQDSLLGARMIDFVHPDDKEVVLEELRALKMGEKNKVKFLCRFKTENGWYQPLTWKINHNGWFTRCLLKEAS